MNLQHRELQIRGPKIKDICLPISSDHVHVAEAKFPYYFTLYGLYSLSQSCKPCNNLDRQTPMFFLAKIAFVALISNFLSVINRFIVSIMLSSVRPYIRSYTISKRNVQSTFFTPITKVLDSQISVKRTRGYQKQICLLTVLVKSFRIIEYFFGKI